MRFRLPLCSLVFSSVSTWLSQEAVAQANSLLSWSLEGTADTPIQQAIEDLGPEPTEEELAEFLKREQELYYEEVAGRVEDDETRQVVFLDFDSATEIDEYNYTQDARDFHVRRFQADYNEYDVIITLERPPSDMLFSTITFNDGPAGGIAEGIDFFEWKQE